MSSWIGVILGTLGGLVEIAACFWMACDAARMALAEPASEWGRSGARVEWSYAALFAYSALFGMALIGMVWTLLRPERPERREKSGVQREVGS